ncbi:MAG: class I SAM-dependent methyltransferase [Synechococcales cyanobacterium RM1_1_8]|nr:class I SAM-dependent methyltransferase [Synechococcales cyanobacterium RM1_1_8]
MSVGGYYSDSHSPEQRRRWYDPVADAYDLARPRYPAAILDRAIALANLQSGHHILEIGCGPGIATLPLAERGFQITAVEPSAQACEIVRSHCVDYPAIKVVNTTFEAWPLEAQTFEAALAATSFHWISQNQGYPKLKAALKPEGSVILLWNVPPQPSEAVWRSLQPAYEAHAPSLAPYIDRREQQQQLKALGEQFAEAEGFFSLGFEKIDCSLVYTVENYIALLRSLSPYILLEAPQRERLMAALAELLDSVCSDGIETFYFSALEVLQQGC